MTEFSTPEPEEPFVLTEGEKQSLTRHYQSLLARLAPPIQEVVDPHRVARRLGAVHYAHIRDMLINRVK